MITKELIEQINYLSRKQRTLGLTEAEQQEQYVVRQQYLRGIREQLKQSLDSITLVDELPTLQSPQNCPSCGQVHNCPPGEPN